MGKFPTAGRAPAARPARSRDAGASGFILDAHKFHLRKTILDILLRERSVALQ